MDTFPIYLPQKLIKLFIESFNSKIRSEEQTLLPPTSSAVNLMFWSKTTLFMASISSANIAMVHLLSVPLNESLHRRLFALDYSPTRAVETLTHFASKIYIVFHADEKLLIRGLVSLAWGKQMDFWWVFSWKFPLCKGKIRDFMQKQCFPFVKRPTSLSGPLKDNIVIIAPSSSITVVPGATERDWLELLI